MKTPLRHDLGRLTASTKGTARDSQTIQSLTELLKILARTWRSTIPLIDALVDFTREHRAIAYVQNLSPPRALKLRAVKFLHGIIGED